jgi:hypothetical protein
MDVLSKGKHQQPMPKSCGIYAFIVLPLWLEIIRLFDIL